METIILIVLCVGALFWVFKLFNDGTIGNVGRLLGILCILIGALAFFVFRIIEKVGGLAS
jgi:membrane-bound ClpP family serine protease